MKFTLPLFALFVLPGCGDPWHKSADAAQQTARRSNQPYLLYFSPTDPAFDRQIRARVFDDPALRTQLDAMVRARIDARRLSPDHLRYAIHQSQTCALLCRPDGSRAFLPFYLNPVPSAEAFGAWLTRARQRAATTASAGRQ